ncbi:hypothetical protein Ancab_020053 [Ancistrocladus abbreviatus]
MEAREILEPLELHYSDLLSLSSDDFLLSLSSSSRAESERLEALTTAIIENLGPNGPGLLAITGVPNASNLRSILLPLARDLALLDNDDRKRILKEHSLGSDVPLKNLDRRVSSFAMQLKYHQNLDSSTPNVVSLKGDDIDSTTKDYLAVDRIFDANKNEIHIIKAPPESFIIQVGESADVLSKGKLHSTLHSVCKPVEPENLSRETFVVFLQPAWNKIFDISDYPVELLTSNGHHSKINKEEPQCDQLELKKVTQEIHRIVPPLLLRIKNGMTFAEFSRETTKQYYGGTGLQSNR